MRDGWAHSPSVRNDVINPPHTRLRRGFCHLCNGRIIVVPGFLHLVAGLVGVLNAGEEFAVSLARFDHSARGGESKGENARNNNKVRVDNSNNSSCCCNNNGTRARWLGCCPVNTPSCVLLFNYCSRLVGSLLLTNRPNWCNTNTYIYTTDDDAEEQEERQAEEGQVVVEHRWSTSPSVAGRQRNHRRRVSVLG